MLPLSIIAEGIFPKHGKNLPAHIPASQLFDAARDYNKHKNRRTDTNKN